MHANTCVHTGTGMHTTGAHTYIIAVTRGDGNTVVSKGFYLGKSILFIFIQMALLSERLDPLLTSGPPFCSQASSHLLHLLSFPSLFLILSGALGPTLVYLLI